MIHCSGPSDSLLLWLFGERVGNSKACTQPIEKLGWIQELCAGRRAGECEEDFPILHESQEAWARNEQ